MNDTITLHGRATKEDVKLEDAIAACLPALGGRKTYALLYSPRECKLALLEDGKLYNGSGEASQLGECYEARLFNEQAEMRWLHNCNGKGRAALIADSPIPNGCAALSEDVSITGRDLPRILKTLPQTYLLWGEGVSQERAGLRKGWSRLTTARIGRLDVPVDGVQEKQRVFLCAKEYMAECDEYGNVAVIEERLLKLEVA